MEFHHRDTKTQSCTEDLVDHGECVRFDKRNIANQLSVYLCVSVVEFKPKYMALLLQISYALEFVPTITGSFL